MDILNQIFKIKKFILEYSYIDIILLIIVNICYIMIVMKYHTLRICNLNYIFR